jgi:hypothetical protein
MPDKKARSLALWAILVSGFTQSAFAQTCPTEDPNIDNAKSNKLFLYFPTAADATFPNFGANVSPAQPFDATGLNSSIGTTAQVIDAIHTVVVDDYCEFNVQVLATTTNPATMANPPARRSTVAVGSDSNGTAWGQAQEVDIGDAISVDFARVWAGTYKTCEGGVGPTVLTGGCSMTGSLTGANATLAHWAEAIGGTTAHEGGHTYGLAHTDDDPPNDPTGQAGLGPAPGEDAFNRHLMPTGYDLTGTDRADYRRHFSDRDYGILATNVGLSVETMHNWDLVNPNAQAASSLAVDFLSTQGSMSLTWSYAGALSPWVNPTVSGPSGTAVFKGTTYNKYRITWSAPNSSWNNTSPGVLAGGAVFHIGAAFTGVDFNAPDPIIIQDLTLFDASSTALALHPRLPSYDAGTLDAASGDFTLQFNAPPGPAQMRLERAAIFQLPRLATIDAMVGLGQPFARDRQGIRPWSAVLCQAQRLDENGARCLVANRKEEPHVSVVHHLGEAGVVDCNVKRNLAAEAAKDSTLIPDYEGPLCAGEQFDPFPSAVVYVIATFVDPNAKHFDAGTKTYVVGPVTSKVYYQFAGIRKVKDRGPGAGATDVCAYCLCIVLLILGVLLLLLLFWFLRRQRTLPATPGESKPAP